MNIQQSTKNKKSFLIAGIIIIVTVLALGYYIFAIHGSFLTWTPYLKKDSSGTNPATPEQINNGGKIKEKALDNSQTKTNSSGSDSPPAPITQPDGKSKVEVTITALNQTNSTLQVRSIIAVLDTTGICTITLLKQGNGSSPVVDTVGVQALANTVTCKGFDVPLYKLSSGTWQITLNFDSAKFTGNTSQNITIK